MANNTEDLVNDIVLKLYNKIDNKELETIVDQIRMCVTDYEVEKKCTDLAVFEGFPKEYQLYLVSKKIEGRSNGTLNLYKLVLENFFATIGKNMRDIASNDIRVYLYNLQQVKQLSDRTLDHRRIILNGFFKWCWEEGYIEKNPCASIKPIHYESKPREPLNDVEMEKMRKACKTPREAAIVEILYSTGCRCSELSNLMISDVNLETREVHLFGKGKKHRTSYLNARALVAIKLYLMQRIDDCPYLICTMRRPWAQLKVGGIEEVVKKIGKRAGIEGIFPHRIRHTFATDALEHGMAVQELQSLLGHSSIDTTMIYAKVKPSEVSHDHHKFII